MGVNISKVNRAKYVTDEYVSARQKAGRVYTYRVKDYDPARHGPKEMYMMQVEAEYELNCIPESLQYGSGFKR
jgi:hypothetical protein